MKYIEFLKNIGFALQNGQGEVYTKSYNDYTIVCDITNNVINYGKKITIHRTTTSNFNQQENLVVLECVDKLLTMGYKPETIELEKPYGAGRKEKGQFLDILLKAENKESFALIECKTFGEEHNKERVKMEQNGGQLFNYFSNQKDADFLILYSSDVKNRKNFRSDIINTKLLKNCPDKKSMMKAWDKTTESNGFFENTTPYNFTPGLRKKDLIEISYSDIYSNSAEDNKTNGTIFNRFAEILRRHTVSDKSNAYNKIFNLFLCKIIDEQNSNNDDILKFQWKNEESPEDVIGRLNELYKVGMQKYMELDVTDHTEEEFKKALSIQNSPENQKALEMFNEIRLYKNNEFAFKEVINQRTFKENAKVVKEVIKLLERYQVKYSHKQQFLGDFFEKLLNIGVKQESGQFFTPVPIARFIVNSIPFESIINNKIQNKEKEYLPKCIDYACGSGHFLTESMDRIQKILDTNFDTSILSPEQKRMFNLWKTDEETKTAYSWASNFIYGIEKDYRLAKTTKVSCFLNGDGEAKILYADGLNSFNHEDYKGLIEKEKFDVVIANPPFSVEGFKRTLENGSNDFVLFSKSGKDSDDIECLFIERTIHLLNENGIMGIILPDTVLTNDTNIYRKTREILLKNLSLVGISELHSTVFAATGKPTIAIFGRKRSKNQIAIAEKLVKTFFEDDKDFHFNQNKNIIYSYTKGINQTFEEYLKMLKNEKFKEAEFVKLVIFTLSFGQHSVISDYKNKNVDIERSFLGYKHSNRKKYEGIHPFPKNNQGKINSKLYTDDNLLDETKVSSYIYKLLNGEVIDSIHESIKNNIFYTSFNSIINWNMNDFKIDLKNAKHHTSYKNIKWKYPTIAIEECLEKNNLPKNFIKLNKEKWLKDGKFPIISQEKELISGYTNESSGLIDSKYLPLIAFGDHTLNIKYIDFEFFQGADGLRFVKPSADYNIMFFCYLLKFITPYVSSGKYSRHFLKLKSFKIPKDVPLKLQEKILSEIKAEADINLIMQKYLIED